MTSTLLCALILIIVAVVEIFKQKWPIMLHEEICTYEVCKLAKEKGFNVDCEAFYYNDGFLQYAKFENWNGRYINKFSAPTQSLLQRWLREEKGIMIEVKIWLQSDGSWMYGYKIQTKEDYISSLNDCNSYELALEDALKYALENLI